MGKYLDLIAANESQAAHSHGRPLKSVSSSPASPVAVELIYVEPQSARPDLERARSLIRTCREHSIELRLEPNGDVVVESNGKAWRALVRDLEQHVDQVAELIAAGWDGNDG